LSIVIVSWNTTPLLEECLRSIDRHPPRVDHEIIVVDNASDGFDEGRFRAAFPAVSLIANQDNAGCAKGNNQGIEASTGDYVLLLNPDTRVTEGALDALTGCMERHEDAAAAGAKLVRSDGTVERSVRGFPYPGAIAWEFLGVSKLFPRSHALGSYRMTAFSYTDEAEVDQPMGSCLIMRRGAIEDVGLFDEAFPIFFNDVDWLYRARRKGWKVYFTPDAVVVHHGAAGTSQVDRRKMIRESHASLIRFYRKHFRRAISAPVYYLTIACIRVGAFLRR
jgi:hypothetical protein